MGGGVPVEAGVLVALAGVRGGAGMKEVVTADVVLSFSLAKVRLTESQRRINRNSSKSRELTHRVKEILAHCP